MSERNHIDLTGLSEGARAEVIDLVARLRAREGELDAETRAWLDADLSRMGEEPPYDWGPAGPDVGEPVYWDAERGAFMVGERP